MKKKRNTKGEGSFVINADGTVTHRKSVGYKTNGNRKVLTVTAGSKAACIREMKKKEATWEKQKSAENIVTGTTILELCELHLKYQMEQSELKPKSIDRRECTIRKHIGEHPFSRMQIQAIKVADIDNHVTSLIQAGQLSASSIEKVVDVLNSAYNWAIMRGELEFNPVAPIKATLMKRIQKLKQKSANEADVHVLSLEEQRLFEAEACAIDESTGRLKYAAGLYGMLLLYTGMRCGEMLALCWKDADMQGGFLTIEKSCSMAKNRNKEERDGKSYIMVEGTTKNEKARKIKLTEEALSVLKQIKMIYGTNDDENARIVKTRTGKPNTATNLEHGMATIFRHAGLTELKGGLHIFRRTFATRMYENGARVKEIAAYIGDLESTTEQYYIAVRKKIVEDGEVKQIVMVPAPMKEKGETVHMDSCDYRGRTSVGRLVPPFPDL